MRSVTPLLPLGVEIVYSSSFKLFWVFLERLFNFHSPVFSIWIAFPCLCWAFSSPFIIIRYSILWTLFLFVAYHFTLLFSFSLLFMLSNVFFLYLFTKWRIIRTGCMRLFFLLENEILSSTGSIYLWFLFHYQSAVTSNTSDTIAGLWRPRAWCKPRFLY